MNQSHSGDNEMERMIALEKTVDKLATQITATETVVTKLLVKLDAHFMEEKKFDKTLRNLDETLKLMQLDLARQPHVRGKEIRVITDNIWTSIRKHDSELLNFKTCAKEEHRIIERRVKDDLRKEVSRMIKTTWALLGVLCILIGGIYYDIREDIKGNESHINRHHVPHGDE